MARACASGTGSLFDALDAALSDIERACDPRRSVRVGVTGGGAAVLPGTLAILRVNEVVAAARGAREQYPSARTVVDLGGQFSKWILLDPDGADDGAVIDFATNGLCAAGSGAFLAQQAGRLGHSVEDLGRAAAGACRGASIAGRCSVFAKSDMIHLQQKGTPAPELALGLCQALVRTFRGMVLGAHRIEPPVVLVGGGAANAGLVRAFLEEFALDRRDVLVPDEPVFTGALTAARAARVAPATTIDALRAALRSLRAEPARGAAAARLPPLPAGADEDGDHPAEDPPARPGPVEAFLGVDVGSVSTNLVLLDRGFEVLQGIYLPTRGRPVEVLDEGLARIRERFGERLRVIGVGTTGSGRHLAARMLGADVVHNEITAQMISALHCVPSVESIFEIGGQDSKYIAVRSGVLVDFEMNKICAAGTGSFLEEEADRLGVAIVGEFSALAFRAERPVDLGTRCTVFMDTELVRARERGATVADLCAGLAYSVSRNYLEKVVGGRPIGQSIVFQGGTASNAAVVAAFRNLLGRRIHVHPHNRISGAIGAALLAARALREGSRPTRFAGFDACSGARFSSFECRGCENRCQVNRIGAGGRVFHFGDACDRYSGRDRETVLRARPFPELFAAREALLSEFVPESRDVPGAIEGEPIGLVRASLNLEYLPLWAAFLRRLGFRTVVSGRMTGPSLQAHAGTVPSEVCLPLKAAAAHAVALLESRSVARIFVPIVLECPLREGDAEAHTCLFHQAVADMLRAVLGDRMVSADFVLQDGVLDVIQPARALAHAFGRPAHRIALALASARSVQTEFERARRELGARALGATFDRAVVVLGKPYTMHDPFLNLGLAQALDRLGLPAIPCDLLPLDRLPVGPRLNSVPWHCNREQLRALELIRRDERLFPVVVSSYGCGPDAFVVKQMEEMLKDTPRLFLEFDEHRGEAGLVTRLEAFADEIEAHIAGRRPRARRLRDLPPGNAAVPRGRRFFIPNLAEHARVYEAVLRSAGLQAEVLPPVVAETVLAGERESSGRECHPYSIIVGELGRLVDRGEVREGDVFMAPTAATPCLIRQYGDALRLVGRRLGSPIEIWDGSAANIRAVTGVEGVMRLYEGFWVTDILFTLATRLAPYARDPEALAGIRREAMDRVVEAIVAGRALDMVLARAIAAMWDLPRDGAPGARPVIGVTGDLYTRVVAAGNAGLFRRLERLGCEVWPSPSFASMNDLATALITRRDLERGKVRKAAGDGLGWTLMAWVRRSVLQAVPREVQAIAVEPPAERFAELAARYAGPHTSYLIQHGIGKVVDFLLRGASGVINAAGINCMVGAAIDAAIPAIRSDHGQAPVISLFYGGSEGPSQRLRLETFVHQVQSRATPAQRAAATVRP